MTNDENRLLELQAVNIGYQTNIVLRHIELTIYRNDFLALLGHNGSGKTSLLKIILGLRTPLSGEIRYFGNPRRMIGYLPQISVFDRKFPIVAFDVVLSGLIDKKRIGRSFSLADKHRAEEVLEQMGIAHLKNKPIGELSGGQMQRAFLGRALISSPELLLLDEPGNFVDSNFESDFYDILLQLNKHMAIILVSHDLGVISPYVKNIACLEAGTLHYHSSNEVTQELLDRYTCPVELIAHGDIPHRILKKHGDH